MGQGFGDAGEPCTRAAGPQCPRRDILPPAPSRSLRVALSHRPPAHETAELTD